jgi:hypothetical protein
MTPWDAMWRADIQVSFMGSCSTPHNRRVLGIKDHAHPLDMRHKIGVGDMREDGKIKAVREQLVLQLILNPVED